MQRKLSQALTRTVRTLLPGLVLIALSIAVYETGLDEFDRKFQVYYSDPADYRFIAEYFWGLPFHGETYKDIFAGEWGDFLRTVPFRQIGMGTLYIVTQGIYHLFGDGPLPESVLPFLLKAMTAAACLLLYASLRKAVGKGAAFALLAAMLFPPWSWVGTEFFLAEGYLRLLFLLALALLLRTYADHDRSDRQTIFAVLILFLFASHLKVQWMLAAAMFTLGAAVHAVLRTKKVATALVLCCASLAIPLSLSAVNAVGWGRLSPTAGSSLHVIRLTGGKALLDVCGELKNDLGYVPYYCHEVESQSFWRVRIGALTGPTIRLLDERVKAQYLADRSAVRGRIIFGLGSMTEFPDDAFRFDSYPDWTYPITRVINIAAFVLLLAGLFLRRTLLLASFGLAIRLNPVIAGVFSVYDARYQFPVAGIALCIGAVIAAEYARVLMRSPIKDNVIVRMQKVIFRMKGARATPSTAD